MNLKKLYENEKMPKSTPSSRPLYITTLITAILIIAAASFIMYLLYNYIAPVWSLPKLGYLQAMATICFLKFLSLILYNRRGDICINQNNATRK